MPAPPVMSTALTPAPVLPLPAWRYLAPIGLAYAAKRGFDAAAVSFDAAWAEVRKKVDGMPRSSSTPSRRRCSAFRELQAMGDCLEAGLLSAAEV